MLSLCIRMPKVSPTARTGAVPTASTSMPDPSMSGCLVGSARTANTRAAGTSILRDTDTGSLIHVAFLGVGFRNPTP
jgi:hypothetical protein